MLESIEAKNERKLFEQLCRVNNELTNVQRELTRRNSELQCVRNELERKQQELLESNKRLELLANSDILTGTNNRRAFEASIAREIVRSRRTCEPLSLMMIDIDRFKGFNDDFGHLAGDDALRRVAELLVEAAREIDVVARFGGEEFAILLPLTDAHQATHAAERHRRLIEGANWSHRSVTASFGLATTASDSMTREELIGAADRALYFSKRTGRNRVTHVRDLSEETIAT